jgi:2-C-methyl-D-erythritol 4-phosphate cytidylyltransferase
MKTVAIIPAGGSGRRMESETPKQYLLLAGLPVLVHTLKAFNLSAVVDEIFLAVPERDIPDVRRDIVLKYGISKAVLVLAGGDRRQDSVSHALAHVRDEQGIVIVHDGVRPFVSGELIDRAVAAAVECGAAAVGVPVKDTVKETDAAGRVIRTVAREGLWLTQTPQAFRREIILTAYRRAAADGFYGTDDASLVERMGTPVRMIPGDWKNIKLTTPEDLRLGEVIDRCTSVFTYPPSPAGGKET